MLRQVEIERILGRRRVQRLIRAKLIEPVRVNNRVIYYAERDLRRALLHIEREGYPLNGRVGNGSFPAQRKVRYRSHEDVLEDISIDELIPE